MMMRLAGVVLTVAAIAAPGRANDHRDGPRIANNTPTLGNIDINDVFIFRSPHHADRTAMIMTLSAAAGVVGPAQFHPGAAYEFRVDNTGDAVSDVVFQVVFSPPNTQGQQAYSVRLMAAPPHSHDAIIAHGRTGIGSDRGLRVSELRGGGKVSAGLFRDPFFEDLNAIKAFIALADASTPFPERYSPFLPPNFPNNFFADFNVIAIALEVPSERLRSSPSDPNISLWCRTLADVGDGRGFAQYDRMGFPGLNSHVIQPGQPRGNPPMPPGAIVPPGSMLDQDIYNFGDPETDASLRPIASARIQFAYGVTAPYADGVAAMILPDVLHFNTRSDQGFFNGRQLADDSTDIGFRLFSNGTHPGDRVVNDQVFRPSFPYLGAPLLPGPTLLAVGASQAQAQRSPHQPQGRVLDSARRARSREEARRSPHQSQGRVLDSARRGQEREEAQRSPHQPQGREPDSEKRAERREETGKDRHSKR
jgi:Domain of unknown function (DUF4331)